MFATILEPESVNCVFFIQLGSHFLTFLEGGNGCVEMASVIETRKEISSV